VEKEEKRGKNTRKKRRGEKRRKEENRKKEKKKRNKEEKTVRFDKQEFQIKIFSWDCISPQIYESTASFPGGKSKDCGSIAKTYTQGVTVV